MATKADALAAVEALRARYQQTAATLAATQDSLVAATTRANELEADVDAIVSALVSLTREITA